MSFSRFACFAVLKNTFLLFFDEKKWILTVFTIFGINELFNLNLLNKTVLLFFCWGRKEDPKLYPTTDALQGFVELHAKVKNTYRKQQNIYFWHYRVLEILLLYMNGLFCYDKAILSWLKDKCASWGVQRDFESADLVFMRPPIWITSMHLYGDFYEHINRNNLTMVEWCVRMFWFCVS